MFARVLFIAMAYGCATQAGAADPLLRCEAPDGHQTYTQGACPAGTKLVQVRVIEPERRAVPERTWVTEADRQRQILRRGNSTSSTTPRVTQTYDDSPYGWRRPKDLDQQRDQCQHVRDRIAYERDLAGNNRSFEQVREWTDREHRACKDL